MANILSLTPFTFASLPPANASAVSGWYFAKGPGFAGEHAECVFIGGNSPWQHAKSVESLRAQALANGRKAEDLKIFGAITVVVGQTDAQALEKQADYEQYASHEAPWLCSLDGWVPICRPWSWTPILPR